MTEPTPEQSSTPPTAAVPPPPGGPIPPPPGGPAPAASSPPPASPPPPAQSEAVMPAGQPVAYPAAAPAPTTSTNAIIALVLAVLSWALCPIIPAIIALVLASMADREIAQSGGRVDGGGLVTAAKIVSWINIGVWAAGIVILGIFLLVLAVAG